MAWKERLPVRVLRVQSIPNGRGGYKEQEAEIPGSPFLARYYLAATRAMAEQEGRPAPKTVTRRVLSFERRAVGKLREGDVCVVPAALSSDEQERRVTVVNLRPYPSGLQVDVEDGTTPADPVNG